MVLVDSNIFFDLAAISSPMRAKSLRALEDIGASGRIGINAVIYAEVSVAFGSVAKTNRFFDGLGVDLLDIPREALVTAGRAFVAYRRAGGARSSPLPDFFVGAHALALGVPLLTRDAKRFATYFPGLALLRP